MRCGIVGRKVHRHAFGVETELAGFGQQSVMLGMALYVVVANITEVPLCLR